MIKVINKGYTLTVTSWENDGDNYNTLSKTVATKEEAKVWYNMMEVCSSANLGNECDEFDEDQKEAITEFMNSNHEALMSQEDWDEIEDYDDLETWFLDFVNELLGVSEYYLCRVVESVVITYSPEDIYLEEIKF